MSYEDDNMQRGWLKKLGMATLGMTCCLQAYAVAPGFYIGLMAGPAKNGAKDQQAQIEDSNLTTTAVPASTQFGSRLFMGYKVNNYAAVEGGLTYFSSINFDTKGVSTCGAAKANVYNFDIVGKGSIPFTSYFDAFFTAGMAVNYQRISGALNPATMPGECGQKSKQTNFKPTYGLGASYNLSQSWVAEVSWTRIMEGDVIKRMDLLGIGISYHFVNRYCGQFLCD